MRKVKELVKPGYNVPYVKEDITLRIQDLVEYVNKEYQKKSWTRDPALCVVKAWQKIIEMHAIQLDPRCITLFAYQNYEEREVPQRQHEDTFDFIGEAGLYKWKVDQVYVNFSNDHLGGGLFGDIGWVQEEILSFSSTIFPLLAIFYAKSYKFEGLEQCSRLFKIANIFHIRQQCYGRDYKPLLGNAISFSENWVLKNDEPPVDSYWLCMPAINRKREPNLPFDQMTEVAIKGFYQAMYYTATTDKLVINTGHWGAGAFLNTQGAVLILQCWALHYCIRTCSRRPQRVILCYHDLAPKVLSILNKGANTPFPRGQWWLNLNQENINNVVWKIHKQLSKQNEPSLLCENGAQELVNMLETMESTYFPQALPYAVPIMGIVGLSGLSLYGRRLMKHRMNTRNTGGARRSLSSRRAITAPKTSPAL